MQGWITSLKRKKHQRAMNKLVRAMNKNIKEDNLWQGRFYMHQVESPQFHIYEDKSGAELWVCLECVDRKTGRTHRKWESVNHWCHFHGYEVWHYMNWFIVEYIEVWSEKPRPGQEGYTNGC